MTNDPTSDPDPTIHVHGGDCLTVLRTLPDNSVHAIVTDPPYGLSEVGAAKLTTALTAWVNGDRESVPDGRGFMGKSWDAFVPPPAVWDECLRVLKPGGHLVAFAGSRTYDLMGLSIRLAGFEIRDGLQWIMGSGFPKSMDVGKAIDKAAGAEREVVGASVRPDGSTRENAAAWADGMGYMGNPGSERVETAPATDAAREWEGWGTALKPACEPMVLARKPLSGTVAATVLAHGTGAINIDATRTALAGEQNPSTARRKGAINHLSARTAAEASAVGAFESRQSEEAFRAPRAGEALGRWPANVLLSHTDECRATGETRGVRTGTAVKRNGAATGGLYEGGFDRLPEGTSDASYGQDGVEQVPVFECAPGCPVAELDAQSIAGGIHSAGAARDHYTTSSPGVATNFGLGGAGSPNGGRYGDSGGASRFFPTFRYQAKAPKSERPKVDGVAHPTVKPLALMRWLVRLVTPPGGTVLDPFAGSGTTLQAAREEGFHSIGIEREADYWPLIEHRTGVAPEPVEPEPEPEPVEPEPEPVEPEPVEPEPVEPEPEPEPVEPEPHPDAIPLLDALDDPTTADLPGRDDHLAALRHAATADEVERVRVVLTAALLEHWTGAAS